MTSLQNNGIRIEFYEICMFLLVCIFSTIFFFMGWSRHYGLMTSINDLGHYDQAIWGILNKGYFLNSSLFNTPFNKLGFHFDPVLYLFSPLYYLKPTPNWLILAQAIALAVSAWPIYQLACHHSQNQATGFLWSAAYLTNPFLINAAAWDFHPITLATPFVACAVLATECKRFYPLLFCCVFILLCKEHFGLMVVGFGLLWLLKHKEIGKSFLLLAVGAIHFLFVFKYLMPLLSPTGEHIMLSKDLGQLSRYSWIGNSITDIFLSIIKNPIRVIYFSLFTLKGIVYLSFLLIPFLGLPLFGLTLLLPAMGDLSANLLSINPMPKSVFAYHSIAIVPLFCMAAIQGSKYVCRIVTKFTNSEVAGLALLASLISCYLLSPYPLPESANFWAPKSLSFFQEQSIDEIKTILDPSASISVQANLGAHFSQREWIFRFPNKAFEADTIILKLESPTTRLSPPYTGPIGTLAHHLQMPTGEYLDVILEVLSTHEYGISYWKNNWLVLKKNRKDICPRKLVEDRVLYLRNYWMNKVLP